MCFIFYFWWGAKGFLLILAYSCCKPVPYVMAGVPMHPKISHNPTDASWNHSLYCRTLFWKCVSVCQQTQRLLFWKLQAWIILELILCMKLNTALVFGGKPALKIYANLCWTPQPEHGLDRTWWLIFDWSSFRLRNSRAASSDKSKQTFHEPQWTEAIILSRTPTEWCSALNCIDSSREGAFAVKQLWMVIFGISENPAVGIGV